MLNNICELKHRDHQPAWYCGSLHGMHIKHKGPESESSWIIKCTILTVLVLHCAFVSVCSTNSAAADVSVGVSLKLQIVAMKYYPTIDGKPTKNTIFVCATSYFLLGSWIFVPFVLSIDGWLVTFSFLPSSFGALFPLWWQELHSTDNARRSELNWILSNKIPI